MDEPLVEAILLASLDAIETVLYSHHLHPALDERNQYLRSSAAVNKSIKSFAFYPFEALKASLIETVRKLCFQDSPASRLALKAVYDSVENAYALQWGDEESRTDANTEKSKAYNLLNAGDLNQLHQLTYSVITTTQVHSVRAWLLESLSYSKIAPMQLVDPDACKMPYVGREASMIAAMTIIKKRFQAFKARASTRKSYPVSFVGACSGLGKSRMLHELSLCLESQLPVEGCEGVLPNHVVTIPMTYNDGNSPLPDEVNGSITADSSFALRLLFFAFCPNKSIRFSSFCSMVPEPIRRGITPTIALGVIQLYIGVAEGGLGVLILPIDEVNHLIEKGESLLDGALQALGSISNGGVGSMLVCPFLAGTIVGPLLSSFLRSGLECIPLPIKQLNGGDLRNLIVQLSEKNPGVFMDWELSHKFMKLFAKFGTHPRLLHSFFEAVAKHMRNPLTSVDDLPFENISKTMNGKVLAMADRDGLSLNVCVKLIADYIFRRRVNRSDFIADGITYGNLEQCGQVVLATGEEEDVGVDMPSSVLCAMLKRNIPQQPKALLTLSTALSWVEDDKVESWQHFERFCCRFEAAREMLLALTSRELLVSIKDIYGSEAVYGELVSDVMFVVSKEIEVGSCLHRLNPNAPNELQSSNSGRAWTNDELSRLMLNTAEGDFCDTLRIRVDEQNDEWLFCGQMKLYIYQEVTKQTLEKEYDKVEKKLKGSPFEHRFVLVFFATLIAQDVRHAVPQRCVIVNGSGFNTFFGPDVAMQAFPFIQGEAVNINCVSYSMLVSLVPGVGAKTAAAIVAERDANGAFTDWDNFWSRMPSLRSSTSDAMRVTAKFET